VSLRITEGCLTRKSINNDKFSQSKCLLNTSCSSSHVTRDRELESSTISEVTRDRELVCSTVSEGFPDSEYKTSSASQEPKQNHEK